MSALLLSLTCTHPTNVQQPFRECRTKIRFGNNMKTKAAKNKPSSRKTIRGRGVGKRHTGPVIIKTESGLHLDLHEGQPHIEPYTNGFDLDIQIKEEPESRDINVAIDCNTTSEVFTNVKNELDSEPLAENELHQSAVKRETEGLVKMERLDAEEEENCDSSRGGDELGLREKASSPSFHPCPHCSVSFTVWDFLEKHIKWVHQEQYLALLRSRLAGGAPGGGPVPRLPCAVCGRTFPSRAHLRSHVREAHPGPPPPQRLHPCPAPGCPRSFQYPKNLANHCRRWHGMSADAVAPDDPLAIPPGAGGLRCGECGREFSTRQRLQVHGRVHTGEKPYECRECGKRFSEQSSWRHHMKIHTGEKAHRCPVCGKAFLRSHHLQYHLTTHSGHKEFACPQCGKRFGYKAGLDSHVQSHSADKPFPCAVCGKAFGTRRNLRVHARLHSAERRVHQCGDCGLKTGDVGALKVHLRTHTGERPYHCTVCGGRFVRISHLRNHQRTHTGERPYECGQCDKSFAQSGDLAKHKRTHTGERPYECPDCHRRYATSGDLGKHARSHSGLRPYACQQCDKSFRLSGHLKTHLLTHTGEKPFACPKCLRRFARSHHLSGHVARCR